MHKTKEETIMRMFCHLHGISKRMRKPSPENPSDNTVLACSPPHMFPGPGTGRVLAILNDGGEISQTQLAKELDIRPQSLSELIVKLESEGWVIRQQSPLDKRQILVSITEKGRTHVAEFRERHREEAKVFLSPLSDGEKDTLLLILDKLIQANKADGN